jgi:hypothetical protein
MLLLKYYVTTWSRVFTNKTQVVTRLVKNSTPFIMQPEFLLPCSKESAQLLPPLITLRYVLMLSCHLRPGDSLVSDFPAFRVHISAMRTTCHGHLILLATITLITSSEDCTDYELF